jgi:tetratricopeptide (TPR) repeat protein
MKGFLFFAASIAVCSITVAFVHRNVQQQNSFNLAAYKKKTVIRCTADWDALEQWMEETDIPPMPGAGNHQWKISTASDSVQFYFNQGMNMYYGFHIIEAMASFKKAARFDSNCAMLFWAQALTYGPNINDYGYRASPEALTALGKAKKLAATVTPFEKELIDAMSVRYTADSLDATRSSLNKAYTGKMKIVYERYTAHADAHALYADAMMLEHPWDLWNQNGTPKKWTPLIRTVLENALVKFPLHPGVNHYYIHLMEPSPYASLALRSAERLGKTNPGLSHLVHMPSHIYLRTGNYQKGVDVNINAVNSYKKSISLYAPVTGADFLYSVHNLHMKTNNAMMMGNESIARAAAIETQNSIPKEYLAIPPPMGNYIQYIYMTPVLTQVRFGKWEELLQMTQPSAEHVYSSILYHFSKGMAYSGTLKMEDAKKELVSLQALMKDSLLLLPFTPFSPAIHGATVAEHLLKGTIALKELKFSEAVSAFETASSIEENMVYDEPRDWLLNPKHYWGNALLATGNGKQAQLVFEKDLKNNNENGWALYGLYQALKLQKKNSEANAVFARFKKAFKNADVKIDKAVF